MKFWRQSRSLVTKPSLAVQVKYVPLYLVPSWILSKLTSRTFSIAFNFHHNLQVAGFCMPGLVYNWFCVMCFIVDVLSNAATI